jgi:hypothetical protein
MNQTQKEITKPVANKTRRCRKGELFVRSRGECFPREEAIQMNLEAKAQKEAEKAEAKAQKEAEKAEAKAKKEAEKPLRRKREKPVVLEEDPVIQDPIPEGLETKDDENLEAAEKEEPAKPTENVTATNFFSDLMGSKEENDAHKDENNDDAKEPDTEKEITKPVAKKTRRCRKGELFVRSRDECFPREEAIQMNLEAKAQKDAEQAEAKAKKEAEKAEAKAKKDAEKPLRRKRKKVIVLEEEPVIQDPNPEGLETKDNGNLESPEKKVPAKAAESMIASAATFFNDLMGNKEENDAHKDEEQENDAEPKATTTDPAKEPENDDESPILETGFDSDDEGYEDNKRLFSQEFEEYHTASQEKEDIGLYPDVNDAEFNQKIAAKREFSDHAFDGSLHKDLKAHSKKLCNSDFELLPHQQFVKNFMSLESPYNSLLLYHELGTGKTCSAIGITEEMRSYMKQSGVLKKIMIIASPNVQDNFKSQLFNPNKLEKLPNGTWNLRTCVGNTLLKEINPMQVSGLSREQVTKAIRTLINKYYRFLGYDSVALYSQSDYKNLVRQKMRKQQMEGKDKFDVSLLDHMKNNLPEILDLTPVSARDSNETKSQKKKVIQRLRDKFDYRLIVVDEFHNMVARRKDTQNAAVRILSQIARFCKHTRLVLLSATPLYNSQEEILWVTNLMNMNDKRAVISENQVFDKHGNFVSERKNAEGLVVQESGEDLLRRKLTGYVSYVRGENPYTFPYRVYPDYFASEEHLLRSYTYPTKQVNGAPMTYTPEKYVLNNVFVSKIGVYQGQVYRALLEKMQSEDPTFQTRQAFNFEDLTTPLSVLNVCYPSDAFVANEEGKYEGALDNTHGKSGLHTVMDHKVVNHPKMQWTEFTYKPEVLSKYGKIFSQEHIATYSSKIAAVCRAIQNSTGIVLIYSRYLEGGLLPMALALEEMGMTRYSSSSHILPFLKEPGAPLNPLTMSPKEKTDKYTAKYAMITGTKLFSHNNAEDLELITDLDNKDGRHVKVVMISEAGSEGLDFKCIRQVHILDPWYNMSRLEQTIGRAVRNKSHCSLELEERNVEIYMHGTILENDTEAADMYMYRLAEHKAIQIGRITRILKESAVDCLLNDTQNNFTEENMNKEIDMKLSSSQKTIKYKVGDKAFSSKCDYMENCELSCKPGKSSTIVHDKSTYSIHHVRQNHERIATRVRELYRDRAFYNLQDLTKDIQAKRTYPIEEIYYTLSQFLQNKREWLVHQKRTGYLILRDGAYVFQPVDVHDVHASVFERTTPLYQRPAVAVVEKNEAKPDPAPAKKIRLNPVATQNIPMPTPKPSALGIVLPTSRVSPSRTFDSILKTLRDTTVFWEKDIVKYTKENGSDTRSKKMTDIGLRTLHVMNKIHHIEINDTKFHLIHHMVDVLPYTDKKNLLVGMFSDPKHFSETGDVTFVSLEGTLRAYFQQRMKARSDNSLVYLCMTKGSKNNLLVWKDQTWRDAEVTEKEHPEAVKWIEQTFRKPHGVLDKVREEGKVIPNLKDSTVGFIGQNKSALEKDGYEFKLKNVLQMKNALGASCEQASKEITLQRLLSVLTYIERANETYESRKEKTFIRIDDGELHITRHHLCIIYEMFLRMIDGKEVWFLGPETAIETDIAHLVINKTTVQDNQVFEIQKKKKN